VVVVGVTVFLFGVYFGIAYWIFLKYNVLYALATHHTKSMTEKMGCDTTECSIGLALERHTA
jgi:hypothetical protein